MTNDHLTTFRTALPTAPAVFTVEHSDRLLLLGSCFTESIGACLQRSKFNTCINPYGIAYNPVSIARCLDGLLAGDQYFTKENLFEHAGLWRSWEHHSRFALPDASATLQGINEQYGAAARFLTGSDRLFLTFGSAVVSTLRETGQIVANNHKMPARYFTARRLSVAEVTNVVGAALERLNTVFPKKKVVLTVSPVRHLGLGMTENQRSKSVLLLACDEICRQLPDNVCYFPAYELLMDDLRDYRFYAPDMVHPSEMAIEYIWQHFSETFFPPAVKSLNRQIEKVRTAAQHRPFNPDTPEHRAFKAEQLRYIETLATEHPYLNFSAELQRFTKI